MTNERGSSPSPFSPSPSAGDPLNVTIDELEVVFRYCPPGTFLMGDPDEPLRKHNYVYQHQVTLTKGFWLLETPVTQELWTSMKKWEWVYKWNPAHNKGENLPVECVSWRDCAKYIKTLNKSGVAPKGLAFDFPTEAEWEYACRAGTTTRYYFGDELTPEEANFGNNVGHTTPVKSYAPNAWGLYDMHGNVREFCSDWYEFYPTEPVTDPTGGVRRSERVDRGGSFCSHPGCCESACRGTCPVTFTGTNVGFRLVLRDAESIQEEPGKAKAGKAKAGKAKAGEAKTGEAKAGE